MRSNLSIMYKIFPALFVILLLASCQNSSKDTVHKHEVEIKPVEINVKVDVDLKVTGEKEEETKKKN